MIPEKNRVYEAVITGYTSEGLGVARIDGMVVFVAGAAQGDRCDILITRVEKSHAYGKLQRLIEPSPDRVENDCPAYPRCGGCDLRHIGYEAELAFKRRRVEDALSRIGGMELAVEEMLGAESQHGYRNKAQYPAAMQDGVCVTGFYRARSHDVVPVERCAIQSPLADLAAQAVREWINRFQMSVYDEKTARGLIRHVYVRVGFGTGEVLVCVVAAGRSLPKTDELIRMILAACPRTVGIVLNVNTGRGNAVMGKECVTLYGRGYIYDELDGLRFKISPLSFYQVNHAQTAWLYAKAVEYAGLDRSKHALDLYCGTGTISLFLARAAGRVTGVEIVPEAVEDAKENAAINGITNAGFLCADAGEALRLLSGQGERPDVAVVDPPRKGLDPQALRVLADLGPERIVYVSCDPGSLARDMRLLSERGYTPARLCAVDMFPRTAHVESIILMTNSGSKDKQDRPTTICSGFEAKK